MKWFLPICLSLIFISCQSDLTRLESQLQHRIDQFDGVTGIFLQHFERQQIISINADTLFPTASLVKIPILLSLFDRIESDSMNYRQDLAWYSDSINYAYDGGILSSFEDGKKIALSKIISLMIMYSDNHASLWCQQLAGGGENINDWLDKNGYTKTRVNSRTPGRQSQWETYGWGQTTPREIAELLAMIYERRAVSIAASEEMYRILTNIYWDDEALSAIPPFIQTASKQGAISQSRSEVVCVNAPSGTYVFAAITKNQQDISWDYDNEGYVLLRDISKLIWNFFEPDLPFSPAEGSEIYH
jgi:beta-lactamase class A